LVCCLCSDLSAASRSRLRTEAAPTRKFKKSLAKFRTLN
jgi:hypothetical protein